MTDLVGMLDRWQKLYTKCRDERDTLNQQLHREHELNALNAEKWEAAEARAEALEEALRKIAGEPGYTDYAKCLPDCVEGPPTCDCAERRARAATFHADKARAAEARAEAAEQACVDGRTFVEDALYCLTANPPQKKVRVDTAIGRLQKARAALAGREETGDG